VNGFRSAGGVADPPRTAYLPQANMQESLRGYQRITEAFCFCSFVNEMYLVVSFLSTLICFTGDSTGVIIFSECITVDDHSELINGLFDKDKKTAYKCLKELVFASEKDNSIYRFFDTFAKMIDDDNSYIRTRGLLLISANAKWDSDYKIDEIIDKYLCHIMDDKPITARQCIKALPNIAKFKPDLVDDILSALNKANPQRYADSMQSLVYKDIRIALETINV